MLEGLEATEIRFAELEDTLRIDAEYHSPRFLVMEETLSTKQPAELDSLGKFIPGPFGSEFHVGGFEEGAAHRYVRGKDVKPFFVTNTDNVYMPAADFERMKEFALRENDVLISVVGTLGNASLVTADVLPAIYSCKSTVFRPADVDARYLVTYLNTNFGRSLLLRKTRGTVQTGLNLPDLKSVLLPRFSQLEKLVADVLSRSQDEAASAESFYTQAETLLLDALGLRDWQPPEPLSYEQTSRAAFAAGRLDAEHFQPKYAALLERMQQVAHAKGWTVEPLGDLSAPLKYGTSTELSYMESGVPFLRIADVRNRDFEPETLKYISPEAAAQERAATVQTDDVLISRSGTLGLAVAISLQLDGAIFGSYFIRTRPDKKRLHPAFLALVVDSLAGRMQVEQLNTGGIQTNLTVPAIESLKIPLPSLAEQEQFTAKVFESHAARRRAKGLLEAAKRAVEIAIEDSEAAALGFLEDAANE